MISTDLLGGKALRLNSPLKPAPPLGEGDTLVNVVEAGLTDKISESISPLVVSLDSVSEEVQKLLHGFKQTTVVLEATMTSFKNTADASTTLIKGNTESVNTILANTAKLSTQLITTQKELDALLLKSGKFADTLNRMKLSETVAGLNTSLQGLNKALADVNAGKGSMGKLLKSDSLYNNLNHSSAALDALLLDMKAHPSRYVHFSVFGKKDK
jgi:phospholipid/cholesterol/gamma-HCH transport system substrate-binding protein